MGMPDIAKEEWSVPVLESVEMSEATKGGVFAGDPICDRFPQIPPCQS